MAIYGGMASDFPAGGPLSQLQPLDAFVFAGAGHKPSTNLTESLIPGRQPYQLSSRQDRNQMPDSKSINEVNEGKSEQPLRFRFGVL